MLHVWCALVCCSLDYCHSGGSVDSKVNNSVITTVRYGVSIIDVDGTNLAGIQCWVGCVVQC